MRLVNCTEFRNHASGLLSDVERGETIVVLRHGKPIAEVAPVSGAVARVASWKRPGLRLTAKGAGLSAAIVEERTREDVP